MNEMIFIMICYIISAILLLLIAIISAYDHLSKNKIPKNNIKDLKYFEELNKIIDDLIITSSKLEFEQFRNNRDFSKVSKGDMSVLIEKISVSVKDSINFDNINFDNSIITQRSLEDMIIRKTIYTANELLSKELQEN